MDLLMLWQHYRWWGVLIFLVASYLSAFIVSFIRTFTEEYRKGK